MISRRDVRKNPLVFFQESLCRLGLQPYAGDVKLENIVEVRGNACQQSVKAPVLARVHDDNGPHGRGGQDALPWRGDVDSAALLRGDALNNVGALLLGDAFVTAQKKE